MSKVNKVKSRRKTKHKPKNSGKALKYGYRPKITKFWRWGMMTRVAYESGISPQHLSDIVHRRKGVRPPLALKLEAASEIILKFRIPWEAWLFNRVAKHPAFIDNGEEYADSETVRTENVPLRADRIANPPSGENS